MDFDNHVIRLQKEMVDITQNLNKFKNKNHNTISKIINNLNVLTNQIEPNESDKNKKENNELKYKNNNIADIFECSKYNKVNEINHDDIHYNSLKIKYRKNKKHKSSSLLKKNYFNNYNLLNNNSLGNKIRQNRNKDSDLKYYTKYTFPIANSNIENYKSYCKIINNNNYSIDKYCKKNKYYSLTTNNNIKDHKHNYFSKKENNKTSSILYKDNNKINEDINQGLNYKECDIPYGQNNNGKNMYDYLKQNLIIHKYTEKKYDTIKNINQNGLNKENDKSNINNNYTNYLIQKNNGTKNIKTEIINTNRENNLSPNFKVRNYKNYIYFNKNKIVMKKMNKNINGNNLNCNLKFNTQRNKNYNMNKITHKKMNSFRERSTPKINLINNNIKKEKEKNNSFNNSDISIKEKNKNIINNNIFDERNINDINMNYYLKNVGNGINDINPKNINLNNKNEINENQEDQKINELLNLLDIENISDTKAKIKEFLDKEAFTNKVVSLFYKYNNGKRIDNNIDLKDIIYWISFAAQKNKENEEYEKYCKELMENNNLNNFDEFKIFIDSILKRNLKNNNFIGGVKKILNTNLDNNNDDNSDTVNYNYKMH